MKEGDRVRLKGLSREGLPGKGVVEFAYEDGAVEILWDSRYYATYHPKKEAERAIELDEGGEDE